MNLKSHKYKIKYKQLMIKLNNLTIKLLIWNNKKRTQKIKVFKKNASNSNNRYISLETKLPKINRNMRPKNDNTRMNRPKLTGLNGQVKSKRERIRNGKLKDKRDANKDKKRSWNRKKDKDRISRNKESKEKSLRMESLKEKELTNIKNKLTLALSW